MLICFLAYFFYGYGLAGLFFSVYFVGWRVPHLDVSAQSMPISLCVLLLPGAMILWPYFVLKLAHI